MNAWSEPTLWFWCMFIDLNTCLDLDACCSCLSVLILYVWMPTWNMCLWVPHQFPSSISHLAQVCLSVLLAGFRGTIHLLLVCLSVMMLAEFGANNLLFCLFAEACVCLHIGYWPTDRQELPICDWHQFASVTRRQISSHTNLTTHENYFHTNHRGFQACHQPCLTRCEHCCSSHLSTQEI